jgi:ACS family glucarate transporter-like MFS transporter
VAYASIALAAFFLAMGTQATDAGLATIVLAGGAGALYLSASSFSSVTAAGAVTASLAPLIAAQLGWTASFMVGSLAWLFVDPERALARTP